MVYNDQNIFAKIISKKLSAEIILENEHAIAFNDIVPQAPIHILIIPNKTMTSLNDIQEEDSNYLSNILLAAKNIAKQFNIHESGYRLITNCGSDGGQEINYLHFHLLGGLKLGKMISLPKSEKKKQAFRRL